jgi:small-conductance mechanosensitive channel
MEPLIASIPIVLAQSAPDAEEIAQALELINFGKLFRAMMIIIIGVAANRFITTFFDRLGEGQAKRRLFLKKVSSFLRLGIFAIGAYLVAITFLEGQKEALLGVGGTVLLAVGFALKDTASSIMSGIMILFDQPFQVGDRVQFGDTYGEVKEIGLRAVRIVTLDDNEVSIPNNKFLTEAVASANSGALDMMVVMPFYIAVTEDFELAKRIVYEACITSKYVFLKKPVVMVVKEEVKGTFCTTVMCKAYVIDARYETAFITDVTERVKRAFRRHRIQAPYNREYSVRSVEWEDFVVPQDQAIDDGVELQE